MRILSEVVHTKEVEYFGCTFNVPEWVRWLSTDFDGTTYGYAYKPSLKDGNIKWTPNFEDEEYCEMAQVDLEGINWRKSLVEVKINDQA
ncbi:hypothetical protein OMDBNIEC_00025 [Salmonella phage STP-SP5]|nr:hypothetical protein OMDBNIEC_00025 [Salmonella phage STP-SP5]